MKINNFALIAIALVGIGLFVLPSTLSMFAGQHSWYRLDGNGVPCTKCHFLEMEELSSSNGPHSPGYAGSLYNKSANYSGIPGYTGGEFFWARNQSAPTDTDTDRCYACHQTAGSSNTSLDAIFQGSWSNYNNDSAHAAVAVLCTDCHPWVVSELQGDNATHSDFYNNLITGAYENTLQKENQACIGCHTHVGVNISWERAAFVSYNVSVNKSGYVVTWNSSDDLGVNTSRFNSTSGY